MDNPSAQPNIPTSNQNPGDLKENGQIADFGSEAQGYGALLNDLTAKIDGTSSTGLNGQSTLAQFADTWAPASDGNDPAQYTVNLANQLGVAPNTPIGTLAPRIGQFAEAIANNEGYQGNTQSQTPANTQSSLAPSDPSSTGMPLWEKALFGAGAVGLGAVGLATSEFGGEALEPEAAALGADALGTGAAEPEAAALGADALGTGAAETESPSLLSRASSAVSSVMNSPYAKAAEGLGLVDTVKNIFSGSSPQADTSVITPSSPQSQQTSDPDMQTASNTSNAITQAVTASANNTQTGNRMMQTQAGIEGAQTIGTYGYTPDIVDDRQNWANASIDAGNKSAELDDTENQLHDAEGATGSISSVAGKAKQIVRQSLLSTEWAEADRQIDSDAQSYSTNFGGGGDVIPLGSKGVGRIRKEGYKAYDRNASTAKNAARKAMGSAANQHMLERTKHKELIGGLHKEKQKLINAQKLMKHLNGKKAPGHKGMLPNILQRYGKYLGTAIGDKIGGGLGAVIGTMVGDTLIKAVDKKFGKSEFESPAMKVGLQLLNKKNPKVYDAVQKELAKYKVQVQKEQRMNEKRTAYHAKKQQPEKQSEYEPYTPFENLPTIKAGLKPKKKAERGLPVIR